MNHKWPALPNPDEWADTLITVHLWTQVIGKIRLELHPWVNHAWGSTLYVSSKGLSTDAIPYEDRIFEIEMNFLDHRLEVTESGGRVGGFELKPMTVADFYNKTLKALSDLNIHVRIFTRPVEMEDVIPFEEDTIHKSYDSETVTQFWHALVQINRVFTSFRAEFSGKSSPSHFFWGAFDLAVTRFSGRKAPKHPGGAPNCADWVMEEAYSRELSSSGFWPGQGLGFPAFYAYAYPAPEGYTSASVQPEEAYYHDELGEFILPYSDVVSSKDPDATLHRFLETTYQAAANLGKWDRKMLEERHPKLP